MIPQINPSELHAWFAQAQHGSGLPIVLDVREDWELQAASIKAQGFELLTIPMGDVPARLAEIAADRAVACLCHHGARSQRVAHFLAQNGFTTLANIAGGIDAWSAQLDASVPHY